MNHLLSFSLISGKTRELEHNLRISKDAAETAQKDLKEYKDKATRILQVIHMKVYRVFCHLNVTKSVENACF